MSEPPEWMKKVAEAGGFEERQKQRQQEQAEAMKYHSKAIDGLNMGAKLGVWGIIMSMFNKVIDFSENPAVKVVMKFLEMFSAVFNAQFGELAMQIAEILWSEESQKNIDDMADKVKTLLGWLIKFMEYCEILDKWLETNAPAFYKFFEDYGSYFGSLRGMTVNINPRLEALNMSLTNINKAFETTASLASALSTKMGELTKLTRNLSTLINPGSGGGSGGGGGGGITIPIPPSLGL